MATTNWNYSDYVTNANLVFKTGRASKLVTDPELAKFAVVAFGKNGTEPFAQFYADAEEASTKYDEIVNAPGDKWYVALFNIEKTATPDTGLLDQSYFGGMQIETEKVITKTDTRVSVVKAGITVLGALGLLAMLAKTK